MIIWKQFRLPLLALTFSSVFLVLGKVIVQPNTEKYTLTPLIFPETVPLSEWQLNTKYSQPTSTKEDSNFIAQKHYQYIQKNVNLDIEMRYVTIFDVNQLIRKYTSISSSPEVRQREKVGYYGLGVDKGRAYLSACINPQGSTTFTSQQFNQNRSLYDRPQQRLLPWLLGKKPIEDKRCLWAHLSISVNNSTPEAAYKKLENVWFSWHQWWQPRFPKL
ncbi:cyanoexosortase A system-associated protein [Scytonema hofmannii FACHB-248]|uniref:Cyanoexosortase A system-associated protein n=1 Tax=Scytonema hofmannii FACHB-248 TaxID=1842502 RepID=A0ABR8GIL7_9CYAN|nr:MULTISPECIES: cyanoexosortase A system-associated protein [Nostocales]MBD2603210.1 cyanoexosortase A system-associated protein [Scytonema hofmannii FACHB-248]